MHSSSGIVMEQPGFNILVVFRTHAVKTSSEQSDVAWTFQRMEVPEHVLWCQSRLCSPVPEPASSPVHWLNWSSETATHWPVPEQSPAASGWLKFVYMHCSRAPRRGGGGGGSSCGGVQVPLVWQARQAAHSGLDPSAALSHVPTGQHAPHGLAPGHAVPCMLQALQAAHSGLSTSAMLAHTAAGQHEVQSSMAWPEIRPSLAIDTPGIRLLQVETAT